MANAVAYKPISSDYSNSRIEIKEIPNFDILKILKTSKAKSLLLSYHRAANFNTTYTIPKGYYLVIQNVTLYYDIPIVNQPISVYLIKNINVISDNQTLAYLGRTFPGANVSNHMTQTINYPMGLVLNENDNLYIGISNGGFGGSAAGIIINGFLIETTL